MSVFRDKDSTCCRSEWRAEGWPYLWCAAEGGGRAIVLDVFFAESKVSQDNVPL